jgi:hypothetical protein
MRMIMAMIGTMMSFSKLLENAKAAIFIVVMVIALAAQLIILSELDRFIF